MRSSIRWSACLAALVSACAGQPPGGDPCPHGFCIDHDGGAATGDLADADLARNGPCIEAWSCTPWMTSGGGDLGTRTCSDGNGCGTTVGKPTESATLPHLDLDYFKCKVMPVLDLKCAMSGCHGTENGRPFRLYHRGRHRLASDTIATLCGPNAGKTVSLGLCEESIECGCRQSPKTANEWQRNFDSARGFGLDGNASPIPVAMLDQSDLIAQPVVGGKAHAGVHLFAAGDADHQVLHDWLAGAALGSVCNNND